MHFRLAGSGLDAPIMAFAGIPRDLRSVGFTTQALRNDPGNPGGSLQQYWELKLSPLVGNPLTLKPGARSSDTVEVYAASARMTCQAS